MGSPTVNQEKNALLALRSSLCSYAAISDETWQAFEKIVKFRTIPKNTLLYTVGNVPQFFT